MKSFITSVLLLSVLVSCSYGLTCYNCTYSKINDVTQGNINCLNDPTKASTITCTANNTSCGKVRRSGSGYDSVERNCRPSFGKSECLKQDPSFGSIKVKEQSCSCDKDNCNSATTLGGITLLPILGYMSYMFP